MQQAGRHQLAGHRAPCPHVQVRPDAEGRQPIVAQPGHPRCRGAADHIDEMASAETLTGADRGRQQLLCGNRAVPQLRRVQAHVAVATPGRPLAEVLQQHRSATRRRLGVPEHGVQLDPFNPFLLLAGRRGVDPPLLGHHVGQPVHHPRVSRLTVAPGAAGLLVVALDRLGHVQVGDEADVRLVDPHTERDRGDHDNAVLQAEPSLGVATGLRAHAGVVCDRVDAASAQPPGGLVHLLSRAAVDDPGLPVPPGQEPRQLSTGVAALDHGVADVGTVEARHERRRLGHCQPLVHLRAGDGVGGGGQGDPWDVREPLVQLGQPQVLRPEVVPPLRHAVRLVDGEQRDAVPVVQCREQLPERGSQRPLRSDVEQVEIAGRGGPGHCPRVLGVQGGVEEGRPHAQQAQRLDLVLHERDERRDHDRRAGPHQGGDLVAQRLAATGRHQDECVPAADHVVHDLGLRAPKRLEPEHLAQD